MSGIPNAHSAPPHIVPWMTQTGRQSSSPEYSKRPSEPVRPPREAMGVGGSILSSGIAVLEPPPSYESRVNDGSMDGAE